MSTRSSALPAAPPRTTTQLLLARGGEPFDTTRRIVDSAIVGVAELVRFLPKEQRGLRTRFNNIHEMLTEARGQLRSWTLTPAEQQALSASSAPSWGEPTVVSGAPAGREPVHPDPHEEPVYGFKTALEGARRYLKETTQALRQDGQPSRSGMQRLYLAGGVAHAAAAIDQLAAVFTAAVWDFERPAMPSLPAKSGRIELRASPRPAPQTRWARYARVMFLQDRVELTTADGRRMIGVEEPIAFLLHVAPPSPTTVAARYDSAERYADVPLYDELGTVHFCDGQGRSMGAIAVADWIAQPALMVAQPASALPHQERLRAFERLVWPLEASGITAGAATLRVPIRRGVLHPPLAHPERALPQNPKATPTAPGAEPPAELPVVADLVRPGPHLLPYRGLSAKPSLALKRRERRHKTRNKDTGPASPISSIIRWFAGPAIVIGGLGSAYLLSQSWFVQLCVILMFAAVLEPWLWWIGEWVNDRDKRRMVAIYRPGAGDGQTRQFLQRAALLFDGANIGVRGATSHEAWVAASSDSDLGVVGLHRLMHDGAAWGFALVDRSDRWRLVIPAGPWAPDGDLTGLAGFAQSAGLQVGDRQVPPASGAVDDALLETSRFATTRSRGPLTRGMVILGIYALAVLPLTLAGSRTATLMLGAVAAIALVPVLLRFLWTSWATRPA
ncbi:MAG: hypothetical protein JJE50_04805 [Actinomycetales bacterium]|nr:hypothetical protein [Actinomycetales bacterium]